MSRASGGAAPQKKALAEGLEVEKKEIGTLHVTLEPADSQLSIDDTLITLPTNGDVYVDPGEHRASVSRAGYESNQQTLHVSKGASQVLWIKLLETGAPPASAAPAEGSHIPSYSEPPRLAEVPSSRSAVPAVVGGGLVVAGAAVGVVFLLAGNSKQNDADSLNSTLSAPSSCGADSPFQTECAKLRDDNKAIDRDRILEVTGFAVAGAAAIGTAVYLLWPHSASTSARGLEPSFAVTPGIGSLGLTGRF